MTYLNKDPSWERLQECEVPVKEPKQKKHSSKELWDMTKAEQIELINKLREKLGLFKGQQIPKYEKGRVELIAYYQNKL